MTDFTKFNASTHPIVRLESDWNNLLEHGLEKSASYIIRKNGSYYEAVQGGGSTDAGTIAFGGSGNAGETDGTDAAAVIQAALDNLTVDREWKEKVVLKGSFAISSIINVPSYTIFDFQTAKLYQSADVPMLQNSNWSGGGTGSNDSIDLVGGVLEGDPSHEVNEEKLYDEVGLRFDGAHRFRVENVIFRHFGEYGAFTIGYSTDGLLKNILAHDNGNDVDGAGGNIMSGSSRITLNHYVAHDNKADGLWFGRGAEEPTVTNITINGLYSYENYGRGLCIDMDTSHLVGNGVYVWNNNREDNATPALGSGIVVVGGTNINIDGFLSSDENSHQLYGVSISKEGSSAPTDIHLANGDVSEGGTDGEIAFIEEGAGVSVNNVKGFATTYVGFFVGNGLEQTIPHGLATIPDYVFGVTMDNSASIVRSKDPDAINIYFTVQNGAAYVAYAIGKYAGIVHN